MAWNFFRGIVFLGCAALILAGCQEQEQIRTYTVPKEPNLRMLAVLVPREEDTWFFKLMGPEPFIDQHVKAFDEFIASIRFTKNAKSPLQFTTPKGWQKEPGDKLWYGTVRFVGEGLPVPIRITRLGPKAGTLKDNIDRWRVKQLGLDELSEAKVKDLEGNVKVDGLDATRVDFVGPGAGKGRRITTEPKPAIPDRPFTFTKPEGWEELPPDAPKGIVRAAVFRIRDKERSAEVTVVSLAGDGGGALRNVNFWREQVGLDPTNEEHLSKDLRALDTASGEASYVDVEGRGVAGPRRILGAWISHAGKTWFLTMKGPPEFVREQKSAFEAFVKSFRLAGGQGAAHE
jgi:hypothetical protein